MSEWILIYLVALKRDIKRDFASLRQHGTPSSDHRLNVQHLLADKLS
jgi:hypothetical protein